MQHRTALQSSMGIGEKPAQGEMFAEFHGDGFREPLTKATSCNTKEIYWTEGRLPKLGDVWEDFFGQQYRTIAISKRIVTCELV